MYLSTSSPIHVLYKEIEKTSYGLIFPSPLASDVKYSFSTILKSNQWQKLHNKPKKENAASYFIYQPLSVLFFLLRHHSTYWLPAPNVKTWLSRKPWKFYFVPLKSYYIYSLREQEVKKKLNFYACSHLRLSS